MYPSPHDAWIQIRRFHVLREDLTERNEMLVRALVIDRPKVITRFSHIIDDMFRNDLLQDVDAGTWLHSSGATPESSRGVGEKGVCSVGFGHGDSSDALPDENAASAPYPFLTPLKEKSFSRIGPISVEYQSNIGQQEAYQKLSNVLGLGEVPSASAREARIESLEALLAQQRMTLGQSPASASSFSRGNGQRLTVPTAASQARQMAFQSAPGTSQTSLTGGGSIPAAVLQAVAARKEIKTDIKAFEAVEEKTQSVRKWISRENSEAPAGEVEGREAGGRQRELNFDGRAAESLWDRSFWPTFTRSHTHSQV